MYTTIGYFRAGEKSGGVKSTASPCTPVLVGNVKRCDDAKCSSAIEALKSVRRRTLPALERTYNSCGCFVDVAVKANVPSCDIASDKPDDMMRSPKSTRSSEPSSGARTRAI